MTFDEYLAEAFGTREIPFGTNPEADNGKFELKWDNIFTDMVYKGQRYRIGIDIDSRAVVFSNRTDGSSSIVPSREAKSSLDVYNRIFYVMMKVIEHSHVSEFRFEGEHDDLKDLYGRFVRNKSFLSMIRSKGWHYAGEKYEGLHVFKKGQQ